MGVIVQNCIGLPDLEICGVVAIAPSFIPKSDRPCLTLTPSQRSLSVLSSENTSGTLKLELHSHLSLYSNATKISLIKPVIA